jgi:hypothetical protein
MPFFEFSQSFILGQMELILHLGIDVSFYTQSPICLRQYFLAKKLLIPSLMGRKANMKQYLLSTHLWVIEDAMLL